MRQLFEHDFAYFFQLPDGRIFFAIPYRESDFTLIGTTDRDHDRIATRVDGERGGNRIICATAANDYFARAIAPADVVWSFAGVRPLVDDGKGRPEAASRGYKLEIDAPSGEAPLLTVLGGKITTYRRLSEEAVGRLIEFVPALSKTSWTAQAPLPGGEFPVEGARCDGR